MKNDNIIQILNLNDMKNVQIINKQFKNWFDLSGLHAILGQEVRQFATLKQSHNGAYLNELTIINFSMIVIIVTLLNICKVYKNDIKVLIKCVFWSFIFLPFHSIYSMINRMTPMELKKETLGMCRENACLMFKKKIFL